MSARLALRLLRDRRLQPLWERLFNVSLTGMNYWSSDLTLTGEMDALARIAAATGEGQVVFDVGANVGDYSQAVLNAFPALGKLHAFEPSQPTASIFRDRLAGPLRAGHVELHTLALSDHEGQAELHSGGAGSATASLHTLAPEALDSLPHRPSLNETVELATLDGFCAAHGIDRIEFLKIDAEGHEAHILRGAQRMIAERRIAFIQFEFGAFNIDSRTYLRDLFEALRSYRIQRIVPGGLVDLGPYHPRLERFATMNYLAELR